MSSRIVETFPSKKPKLVKVSIITRVAQSLYDVKSMTHDSVPDMIADDFYGLTPIEERLPLLHVDSYISTDSIAAVTEISSDYCYTISDDGRFTYIRMPLEDFIAMIEGV